MSKKDPFNFDDVFIAQGAGNLVKKSLADLKTNAGAGFSTSAVPASQPPRHDTASLTGTRHAPPASGKPAAPAFVDLGGFALDDMFSSKPAPSAAAAAASKPAVHVPAAAAPVRASADPFDMFGDVHGAQPAMPAPAAPAAAPLIHHDDDDLFQLGSSSAVSRQGTDVAAAPQPSASDIHFHAFDDSHGFDAFSQPAAPAAPPAAAAPAHAAHTFDAGFGDFAHASTLAPGPLESARPSAKPVSVMAEQPQLPQRHQQSHQQPPLPTSSYSQQPEPARRPPAQAAGDSYMGSYDAAPDSSAYDAYGAAPGDAYEPSDGYHHQHMGGHRARKASGSGGGGGSAAAGTAASSGGVVGLLRGFGKKAVKAAQAGLQHLESALEKLDQGPGASSQQQGSVLQTHAGPMSGSGAGGGDASSSGRYYGYGGAGPGPARSGPSSERLQYQSSAEYERYDGTRRSHSGGARSHPTASRTTADDDPVEVALTLLALPLAERGECLAAIPQPMRKRVAHALHELGGEAPPPPSAHAAAGVTSTSSFGRGSDQGPASAGGVDVRTHVFDAASPAATAAPAAAASGAGGAPAGWASFEDSPAPAAKTVGGAAPAAHAEHHDLLGMADGHAAGGHGCTAAAAAAAPPPAPPPAPVFDDLLGGGASHAPPAAAHAQPPEQPQHHAAAAAVDVEDVHDFFHGGPSGSASAGVSHANSVHDFFGGGAGAAAARPSAAKAAGGPSLMMDLHDALNVDTSKHGDLYEDAEGAEGEPELRRQLRAARLAEKHAKMRAALAEKQAADEAEAKRREQQVELKETLKAGVDTWKNKNKGNIRGLLGSLQTVMWEGSGWQPISVADLLEPGQIRKAWMKANLLVHPDKVRQRNGTPEQVAIADMIFDVLKDAWNTFQTTGR